MSPPLWVSEKISPQLAPALIGAKSLLLNRRDRWQVLRSTRHEGKAMVILARTLAALLVLGAAGHTMGSLQFYKGQPHALFWALCTSVLIIVIAAMNWLRADRPQDHGLAWVTAAATLAYAGVSIAFGFLIGNPLDWRALSFAAVSLVLAAISVLSAVG